MQWGDPENWAQEAEIRVTEKMGLEVVTEEEVHQEYPLENGDGEKDYLMDLRAEGEEVMAAGTVGTVAEADDIEK